MQIDPVPPSVIPRAADHEPGDRSEREPNSSHVIRSGRLLRGHASVTIDHEGIQYVLRATRAGKLILTK